MLVYAGQHHRRKVRDSLLIYCRIDGEECTLKAIWEAQESRLSRDKTRLNVPHDLLQNKNSKAARATPRVDQKAETRI